MARYIPSDPLFHLQWHLLNTGNTYLSEPGNDINVVSVWPDYSGKGVLIGVMDTGIDESHPDLLPNYRADLAWDAQFNVPGGAARYSGDDHGTSVAGLVAAANNGLGGVGVAWGAEFTSFRMLLGRGLEPNDPSPRMDEGMWIITEKMLQAGADVMVNSWGFSIPFGLASYWENIVEIQYEMAAKGRGGLGIATLYAAGNAGNYGADSDDSPLTDNPWVIVVAAGTQYGGVATYSTPGASVLVTAPGSEPRSMVTTDRQGSAGYNKLDGEAGDYTDTPTSHFNGTSSATPVAAGVVALMLEANAGLGYRDIQEILVYSSSRVPHIFNWTDTPYFFNGSGDWNGGALMASHHFGYGSVDAHAAVRLAESWMKTGTVHNVTDPEAQILRSSLVVGAGQAAEATASFAADYRVEQMLVEVHLETDHLEAVTIELISPQGTISKILNQPPVFDPELHSEKYELPTKLEYPLNTVLHWGESLAGEWTLRITNKDNGSTVTLSDWALQAVTSGTTGHRTAGTQIFTDEYETFAVLQPGRTTIDAAKGATLNAAAVTRDVYFDLEAGSKIGSTAIDIVGAQGVRNLISGDGNDVLIGNANDNILMPGRGDDQVDGGAGLDVLRLIGQSDQYSVEMADDGLAVYSHGLADGGVDVIRNVELIVFSNDVRLVNAPTAHGGDLFDEAAYLRQNPDVAAAVAAGQLASGRAHYVQWGASEGRNPNDLFSEAWYLTTYDDVAQAVQAGALASGFQHYLNQGWTEGRLPSAWMNTEAYLAQNPDVQAAQVDPLQHFLLHGVHEGRSISAVAYDFWV